MHFGLLKGTKPMYVARGVLVCCIGRLTVKH